MYRASLLYLCLNSLHKADVWAYILGLRFGLVPILFTIPSSSMKLLYLRNPLYSALLFEFVVIFFLFFLVIFDNGFWDLLENILK